MNYKADVMWCDSLPILRSRASQETRESRYVRLQTVSSFSLEVYTFIREQGRFKFHGVKLKPLKGCLIQSNREKETFDKYLQNNLLSYQKLGPIPYSCIGKGFRKI